MSDDTIRALADRLDAIIEADDEGLWIDPKGEQLPENTDAHHFVSGSTGIGRTTILVDWFRKTADDGDLSTWIDPNGVDGSGDPRSNPLDREFEGDDQR